MVLIDLVSLESRVGVWSPIVRVHPSPWVFPIFEPNRARSPGGLTTLDSLLQTLQQFVQSQLGNLALLPGSDAQLLLWIIIHTLAQKVEYLSRALTTGAHNENVTEPLLILPITKSQLR